MATRFVVVKDGKPISGRKHKVWGDAHLELMSVSGSAFMERHPEDGGPWGFGELSIERVA
jgi:hypothetical protein